MKIRIRDEKTDDSSVRKKNYNTGSFGIGDSFSALLQGFNLKTTIKNPYKQYVWAYSCINLIATAVAGIPAKFYKGESSEPLKNDNEWVELFNRPNPLMVGTQFWKFLAIYYETFGEVFIIPRDKNYRYPSRVGEVPGTLELADPRNLEPRMNGTMWVGWTYTRGTVVEQLDINQVIRFWEFDTDDVLEGMPASVPGALTIAADVKAHKYNDKFFESGGQIQGILTAKGDQFEDLKPEEVEKIRSDWDSRYHGERGQHRTPILTNGLEYVRTGVSQKDMDFKELMNMSREEVFAMYKVPKTKLGLTDKVDRAVAKVFNRQFYEDNIQPKMKDWASVVSHVLLRGTGIEMRFDFTVVESLREDQLDSIKVAKGLQELGYGLNEINAVTGLGMEEIGDDWANEEVDTRTSTESEENVEDAETEDSDGEGNGKGEDDKSARLGKKRALPSNIADLSDEEFLNAYHSYVTEGNNTNNYEKEIELYFEKLRANQISLLQQLKDCEGVTKDSSDEFLFDEKKWDKELKEDSEAYFDSAVIASVTFLSIEVGGFVEFDPANDSVIEREMKRKLARLTGINATVREQAREVILLGVAEGWTVETISEEMDKVFARAKKRSKTIAMTEIGMVAAFARFRGMSVEGLLKKWVSAGDSLVRRTHKNYASLGPKNLDYDYTNGNNLRYPGDMRCSDGAEVINCRCAIRAIKTATA